MRTNSPGPGPSVRPVKVLYEYATSIPWRSYEAKRSKQIQQQEGI